MVTQAQVKAVHASEDRADGNATLPIELDDIPGAVWQAELQALMPSDTRVSLFERGGQKFALVTFPAGQAESAEAAFRRALHGANEVSADAHRVAASQRSARELAARARQTVPPKADDPQ